ncbi:MAG: hypothetical protein H6R18_247 [Proteobacteria bacterium]|nr:hypothetical protein [Pseudomonadota bacterium]
MTALHRNIFSRTSHGALLGQLTRPEYASALVLLPRTGISLAHVDLCAGLVARNIATLSIELLTIREAQFPDATHNTALLTERLTDTLDFIRHDGDMQELALGLYAVDHITPAAIRATAQRDRDVLALVTENGFISNAGREYLEALATPLLVLIDVEDIAAANAARRAFDLVQAAHELRLINPHEAASEAAAWFERWLVSPSPATT